MSEKEFSSRVNFERNNWFVYHRKTISKIINYLINSIHHFSFRSTFLSMMLIIDIKVCLKRSTISFCFDVFDTINFHSMSCLKRWLSNSSLKYFFFQSMRRRRIRLFSCLLCCWKCLKTSNVFDLTQSTYIIDRLIKSHKKITKYLNLSLNTKN